MTEEIVKHQETAVAIPSAQNLRMLAQDFVNSGLFPLIKSVPEAIAKIQAGQELGIPPIASLNTMTVINSRLTMDAKLLLALAQKRAGVSWKILQETDEICEMEFSRPGFSPITVSFETKEAQVAGLLGKANWKNYKKDMLFARCSSRGVRRIAPDAVLGLYSTEEMMDAIPLGQAKVATPLAPPPSVVAPEPSQPQKQDLVSHPQTSLNRLRVLRMPRSWRNRLLETRFSETTNPKLMQERVRGLMMGLPFFRQTY